MRIDLAGNARTPTKRADHVGDVALGPKFRALKQWVRTKYDDSELRIQ